MRLLVWTVAFLDGHSLPLTYFKADQTPSTRIQSATAIYFLFYKESLHRGSYTFVLLTDLCALSCHRLTLKPLA